MIPIHELLNRIRWDKQFGSGKFELGYYDRIRRRVIRIPFSDVEVDPESPNFLWVHDQGGEVHSVPLHRVKDVYRDDKRIWHRNH